jgi:cell division protein FtsB
MDDLEAADRAMSDVDVYVRDIDERPRRVLMATGTSAIVLIAGIGAWQFLSLHHQVSQLRQTRDQQSREIQQLDQELSKLHSSVNAAVGCLQTPQAQAGLCSKFLG